MPTSSKKSKKSAVSQKSTWIQRVWRNQKARLDDFMNRRPHRSFRLTRRRDYVHPLELPNYFSFTHEVSRTVWRHKGTFLLLMVVYIVLYSILVGVQSQETYASLTDTIDQASEQGTVGTMQKAGLLFISAISAGASTEVTEGQQIFSVLIFLLVWLTTVWLLRNLLAGHKVRLRDGLYNSGSPIFATVVVALIIGIQLIPVAIALIGYEAALNSGLLDSGAAAMLFWIGAALLVILSIFWITSSLFAMIIITLPGMYPLKAIKSAGDIVLGRRIQILLRWVWMAVVIALAWAIILIPIILIDMGIKSVWADIAWVPIVPAALLVLAAGTAIWTAAYIYLLYRKVVEYAPEQ